MTLMRFLHSVAATANEPFPWLIYARRLFRSAHLLDVNAIPNDPFRDVRNVARMCVGMSIECYFKAYFVATGNRIHDGKRQNKIGSHDLGEMARKVGFSLAPTQERVLHYLSSATPGQRQHGRCIARRTDKISQLAGHPTARSRRCSGYQSEQ